MGRTTKQEYLAAIKGLRIADGCRWQKPHPVRKHWAFSPFPGILCRMNRWLTVVLRLVVAGLKSRRNLLFENLALRHQVLVLCRRSKRPRLTPLDRALWAWTKMPRNRARYGDRRRERSWRFPKWADFIIATIVSRPEITTLRTGALRSPSSRRRNPLRPRCLWQPFGQLPPLKRPPLLANSHLTDSPLSCSSPCD